MEKSSNENRHFVLIIAGDNPEELVKPYADTKSDEPYIVFKYKDRAEARKNYLKVLKGALMSEDFSESTKKAIKERIKQVEEMSNDEYYLELTEEYDLDDDTWDAISDVNPNRRYSGCEPARRFAVPFLLKDGEESFSAKKGDIDWETMMNADRKVYEFAWDTVMEGKKPETDEEKLIHENMKNRKAYFESFGNRDNYVSSNTAFWGYAFLSEETGWIEYSPEGDHIVWVLKFFDRYIKDLPDDTLLSIYECTRYY